MYDLHFQQWVCSVPGSCNLSDASSQLSLFIVLPSCGGLLKSQLQSVQQVAAFHLFCSKHIMFLFLLACVCTYKCRFWFLATPTEGNYIVWRRLCKVSTRSIFHGQCQPNKLNLIYRLILIRGFQNITLMIVIVMQRTEQKSIDPRGPPYRRTWLGSAALMQSQTIMHNNNYDWWISPDIPGKGQSLSRA